MLASGLGMRLTLHLSLVFGCMGNGRAKLYHNYSGKLSRQKNFANFAVLWLFMRVFSTKFGGGGRGILRHGKSEQFAKVSSGKIVFFDQFTKVSPSKVSRYTVHNNTSTNPIHNEAIGCTESTDGIKMLRAQV